MTIEIARTEIRVSVRHENRALFVRLVQIANGSNWQQAADGFALRARAVLSEAARRHEGVEWP